MAYAYVARPRDNVEGCVLMSHTKAGYSKTLLGCALLETRVRFAKIRSEAIQWPSRLVRAHDYASDCFPQTCCADSTRSKAKGGTRARRKTAADLDGAQAAAEEETPGHVSGARLMKSQTGEECVLVLGAVLY